MLREACVYAAGSGTILCIEFLSRFETDLLNTTAQAVQLADEISAPNLGLVFGLFGLAAQLISGKRIAATLLLLAGAALMR